MKNSQMMIFAIVALVAVVGAYVVINEGSTMGEAINIPGATCSETDGGAKAYVKGITTISTGNGTNVLRQEVDTCVSSKNLIEYDCPPVKKLNMIRKMVLTCPKDYVCHDGACKRPADICTPKVCADNSCGSMSNGCGGMMFCGNCSSGQACSNNQCLYIAESGGSAMCAAPECPAGQIVNYTGTVSGDQCQDFNCIMNSSSSGSGNQSASPSNQSSSPSNQSSGNQTQSCTSESYTVLCSRLGKNCGTVNAVDNCNVSRSVNCGSCSSGQVCTSNNTCQAPGNNS